MRVFAALDGPAAAKTAVQDDVEWLIERRDELTEHITEAVKEMLDPLAEPNNLELLTTLHNALSRVQTRPLPDNPSLEEIAAHMTSISKAASTVMSVERFAEPRLRQIELFKTRAADAIRAITPASKTGAAGAVEWDLPDWFTTYHAKLLAAVTEASILRRYLDTQREIASRLLTIYQAANPIPISPAKYEAAGPQLLPLQARQSNRFSGRRV